MNKEEEEFIKERERNRELMEEIAREIEMTCSDINECNTGEHNCDVTSWCYNTIGSFGCACREGYSKNGEDKCTVSIINVQNVLLYQGIRELLKRLQNIRSLKGHYKEVEHENCVGDTDCCKIIRKCDEELGEVAGKLDTRINVNECATGKRKCNGSSICHNTKGYFLCICLPKYLGVNCTGKYIVH
ncbi:unnamed protein product [Porites evermanni]|uniref:EGF-like domain-containing protein n=1 Tax=Porites evermanni TaxID=104178 RepID=A0ABN8RRX1_9CNID|nr:unnamed protein product [Porites evermanni]